MNWKEFLASPQACILALAAVFIVLRLFAPTPFYYVGADEARYLALAHNFPHHTMHGGTLFLQHMPMYPYLIAITTFVLQNDLATGLIVSFAMSISVLAILLKLFKTEAKTNTWFFLFSLLFSLNWALVELSRIVFKETTYIAFWWSAIAFYWLGLKRSPKWLWLSGIFAALTAFASDQVIFLFPAMLITLFLIPSKRAGWHKYIPIVIGGIAYALWIAIRLQFYMTHTFAPVGIDGIIEDVSQFTPGNLLNVFSFPESDRLSLASGFNNPLQIAANLGYLLDTYPFLFTPNLSRAMLGSVFTVKNALVAIIWYIPLLVLGALWLWKRAKQFVKEKKLLNNTDLIFAAYLILLVLPILSGVGNWRHIILSVIPVLYFETQALFMLFNKFMEKEPVRVGFVILSALFIVCWIVAHPHFSLGAQKIVQGNSVANELRALPGDGIFVQTGYSMELDYLLPEKRVYGIVSNSTNLQKYIKEFNISYLVLGNKTWAPADEPSLDFIRAHPELFAPIKTVNERYPINSIVPDVYTIYQVKTKK